MRKVYCRHFSANEGREALRVKDQLGKNKPGASRGLCDCRASALYPTFSLGPGPEDVRVVPGIMEGCALAGSQRRKHLPPSLPRLNSGGEEWEGRKTLNRYYLRILEARRDPGQAQGPPAPWGCHRPDESRQAGLSLMNVIYIPGTSWTPRERES